jgi:hypothetical protein
MWMSKTAKSEYASSSLTVVSRFSALASHHTTAGTSAILLISITAAIVPGIIAIVLRLIRFLSSIASIIILVGLRLCILLRNNCLWRIHRIRALRLGTHVRSFIAHTLRYRWLIYWIGTRCCRSTINEPLCITIALTRKGVAHVLGLHLVVCHDRG